MELSQQKNLGPTNFKSVAASAGHHRQTRCQTDKLEADLWTWRSKCREDGKKIPKRLVLARAKWAFQKQGISDFKVIEFRNSAIFCASNSTKFFFCLVQRIQSHPEKWSISNWSANQSALSAPPIPDIPFANKDLPRTRLKLCDAFWSHS